jgi:DNA polymerase III epsilon subunit family exonuclease
MAAVLQRKLSEMKFVAFDVETTGLDPQLDEVIEVGLVRFHVGGMLETYDRLIDPGCPIPRQTATVHGITDLMVERCPSLEEVLFQVVRFFDDSILVAHNAKFDLAFFNRAFAEAGVAPPRNVILCTRRLSRALIVGLRSHGLKTVANELHVLTERSHRALPDAQVSAKVFMRLVGHLDPLWDITLEELLAYHGRPYTFLAAATPSLWEGKRAALKTFRALRLALKAARPLRIEYRSERGENTRRTITPLKIDGGGPDAKVVAYCHLRRENRTFRLDCIVRVLEKPFEGPNPY